MRAAIERLVAFEESTRENWLEAGAGEDLVGAALAGPPRGGRRVGDYLVQGVLGSGGMATVLEAEQQHPRRRVALKVMRFGLCSETARRRFEYESEVLANLRHPGIAQVYACGTHRDEISGQELPYFAMELVEGARPLSTYVSEEELDLEALLRLFLAVCRAVHHGHQHGVIHRDLKPQNLLVDRDGRPKIIDFGIARAIEPQARERAAGRDLQTSDGEVLGTLHYMSPEQLGDGSSGLDLRCDVYALGVILYELVAGRLPFDLDGRSITAAIQVVATEVPPRPSAVSRARPSRSRRLEELDWIVLKALEKERDRRYPSVTALADDVERVLADEPIAARPPSWGYLTRKFVTRHRVGMAAAAVVVASLSIVTIVTTLDLARTREAERQALDSLAAARLEADTHAAVNDFLTDMLKAANPYVDGREVKVIDLLDSASARAAQLYTERPPYAAALRNVLGNTYIGIGQLDEASGHLGRARRIGLDHLGAQHPVTLEATHGLAVCHLGRGEFDEAEELARIALAGRRATLDPGDPDIAATLVVLAQLAQKREQLDAAREMYVEARDIFLRRPDEATVQIVQTSSGLGSISQMLGRMEEARAMLEFARQFGEQHLEPDHPSLLVADLNLGSLLLQNGDNASAVVVFERVLRAQERVLGRYHANTLVALNNLASALQKQGEVDRAERQYRDLIERRRHSGQAEHYVTALSLGNLGVCLESQDRLEEAEECFVECLALLERCGIPARHWMTAAFRKGLAVVHSKQGRHSEAVAALEECLAIFEEAAGDQSHRIRSTLEALADVHDRSGEEASARDVRARLTDR